MSQDSALNRKYGLIEFIFYGNYFYGLCAVALAIEASLQQRSPLNGFLYFFIIFIATILYYTHPYVKRKSSQSTNPRTNWYKQHYKLVWSTQVAFTVILSIALVWFLSQYGTALLNMSLLEWTLTLIFPVVAALYYGFNAFNGRYSLRKIGWLKPFIIGFIWAGFVNVYPVLFYEFTHGQQYEVNLVRVLLFIKNLMFVAVLCIMFDIKDYSADYLSRLRTFVVEVGLRKTIFFILLPLTLAGLTTFIYYGIAEQFHPVKILLNVVPFILLIIVAWSLRKRRSLLYYLIVVDGLMLVKAVCGSIAMTYF